MGYKAEVQTGGSKWDGNGLTFAIEDEAREYAKDLMRRWTRVTNYRVVSSPGKVNYTYTAKDGAARIPLKGGEAA
jgi:hypothetical protein